MRQLERKREELFADNRRMAEMLATSEGESREVADMLERLAGERKQLQRQCQQLRENGRVGDECSLWEGIYTVSHTHTHTHRDSSPG